MADFSGPRFEPGGLGRHHRLVGLMRSQGGEHISRGALPGPHDAPGRQSSALAIAENDFAHLQAASAGRGRVERPTSARDWREKSTPVGGWTATEAADALGISFRPIGISKLG